MDDERWCLEIAKRLRWHRKTVEGMTQSDYTARIGVKRAALNNWENCYRCLSLHGALKMRQNFGLSLDFLHAEDDGSLPMTLTQAWRNRDSDKGSIK